MKVFHNKHHGWTVNVLLVQTSPCGEVWFEIWLKAHGKIWNHTRRSRVWFQIFPCALKAKSQITPLRRVMFAINTTTTSCRVCFNPKRTEKPKVHGFSVRFWLKHTLREVVVVKFEITLGCASCDFKFFRVLWAKSQITPLRRLMFAINTTTTSAECALTQSARKNHALWVFLCALG